MRTLLDTTTLRQHTLKNRVWRSATWLALADAEGNVTDEIVLAYEKLAKGGVAMIVTGLTSIVKHDAEIGGGVKFYDERFIEGHKRLTNAIHRHNALVMMQTAIVDGPVDELSTEQVEDIVRQFGDAAHRAEQAGYDGVQIHAAHFFYLSKFISPLINHRTDRFGGDQRNRTRILYEILKDMRSKTSTNFIITIKINSTDEYPGGLTLQDFMLSSKLMADAGIDAIEVSANGTSHTGIKPYINEGYFRTAAMALAAFVDTPIVLVGGLRSIDKINQYLAETIIEYVSLSRPLVREPNLIQRWQQGDTTPSLCISCNTCYRTPGHQCIFNMRGNKA
ncbi:MAG: NADH:flavin oxidoreductase [Bacteroidaceae bacterium]|nr:NADH:flavin oxidoreductase [Bacteroidaceae bacterium]